MRLSPSFALQLLHSSIPFGDAAFSDAVLALVGGGEL